MKLPYSVEKDEQKDAQNRSSIASTESNGTRVISFALFVSSLYSFLHERSGLSSDLFLLSEDRKDGCEMLTTDLIYEAESILHKVRSCLRKFSLQYVCTFS